MKGYFKKKYDYKDIKPYFAQSESAMYNSFS